MKVRGVLAVLLVVELWLLAWVVAAPVGAAQCFTCGTSLDNGLYLLTDRLAREKRQVCPKCTLASPACYVCGLPVPTNGMAFTSFPDGRYLCRREAQTAVLDDREAIKVCQGARDRLDRIFSRFMTFPETNLTVNIVDRPFMESLFKYPGQERDCPTMWGCIMTQTNSPRMQHTISLLAGLPIGWLQATYAHEYTHAWLHENLSRTRQESLSRDSAEGFCELVAYRLMESFRDEGQMNQIKLNLYTRGQFQLLLEAEERYGFNDLAEWMRHGTDGRLAAEDPGRIRRVELPRTARMSGAVPGVVPGATASVKTPESLVLKAVFWDPKRPSAIINGRSLRVNEQALVPVGSSNVNVRCLEIRPDGVTVQVAGKQRNELSLRR